MNRCTTPSWNKLHTMLNVKVYLRKCITRTQVHHSDVSGQSGSVARTARSTKSREMPSGQKKEPTAWNGRSGGITSRECWVIELTKTSPLAMCTRNKPAQDTSKCPSKSIREPPASNAAGRLAESTTSTDGDAQTISMLDGAREVNEPKKTWMDVKDTFFAYLPHASGRTICCRARRNDDLHSSATLDARID